MSGRTLGVVGTLVWDRYVARSPGESDVEGWGGIAYSLTALAAALEPSWRVRPIVKVGRDLAAEARVLLAGLPNTDFDTLIEVDEPNNRVELRYYSDDERTERLTGGVPGWAWPELEQRVTGCDALYLNFISGHEMELDVAEALRAGFDGPIYADLHSLFLGVAEDGVRVPRPLAEAESWLACFDAVQVNAAELELLSGGDDPWAVPRRALEAETELFLVTLGDRGAAYLSRGGSLGVGSPVGSRLEGVRAARPTEQGTTRVVTVPTRAGTGDPTGCGDVWGAVASARLFGGASPDEAVAAANRLAAAKLGHRGAEGLGEALPAALGDEGHLERVKGVG